MMDRIGIYIDGKYYKTRKKDTGNNDDDTLIQCAALYELLERGKISSFTIVNTGSNSPELLTVGTLKGEI